MDTSTRFEITAILDNAKTISGAKSFLDIVRGSLSHFEVVEEFELLEARRLYLVHGLVPQYDAPEEVEPITLYALENGAFILGLDNGNEYLLIKSN